MQFETLAVHAGHEVDAATGAVAAPLHLSTTFARDEDLRLPAAYGYVRESNPTQAQLESALAAIEGGAAALVFGSGAAAGSTMFQILEPGSHILFPSDVYYGYLVAAVDFLTRWGIEHSVVDMQDLSALAAAIRPNTRMVWLESPSNPLLRMTDLAPAIELARAAGVLTVVDNTFPTPVLQRPIELGADVVLHSTTKYIGGHTDVQGGALVFRERGAHYEHAEHARHVLGAVAAPFNSWLVLRGLRTLSCRMEVQCRSALVVARALEGHPAISSVHYPGLASDPGHAIARRQMSAFGAMISFHARAGGAAAKRVVGRARLFYRATSLGGVESLIEHRRTSEGANARAPEDLIRLSIGLEHPDDLIADLLQALA
ncbi:MAG: aminotransferase class I/II-fold pyridoxal phosphate-dependent enzyme [Acidobacteriota bacterium]